MNAVPALSFRVDGEPQPRGSKKPITVPGRRRGLLIDDNPKSGPWMDVVRFYAKQAMAGRKPCDGPMCLKVIFYRERPESHYRKGGGLKASAPAFPHTKPDADKLLRAVQDAMKGVVYTDDSRIVDPQASKRWGKQGCDIWLYTLPETVEELERGKGCQTP